MSDFIKNYIRRKAFKSALRVLAEEVRKYKSETEKTPGTIELDLFNSGLHINLKQAKRRALGIIEEIIEKERNKKH